MAFYGGSLVEIATATPRNDNVGRREWKDLQCLS